MIVNATIKRDYLRAALCFAAKKDIRYYLNGVLVELHPTCAFIVATDDNAIGVFKDSDALSTHEPRVEFVIPREIVQQLKAYKHANRISLTYDTDTRDLTLHNVGADIVCKAIAGKYPDWRRVFPSVKCSGVASQFNPCLLAKFSDAAVILNRKAETVFVHHNGDAPSTRMLDAAMQVEILGEPNFRGVLMPFEHHEVAQPLDTQAWSTPTALPEATHEPAAMAA